MPDRRETAVVMIGVALCSVTIILLVAQQEVLGGIALIAFFAWMVVGGWLIRRSDPHGPSGRRGWDGWP